VAATEGAVMGGWKRPGGLAVLILVLAALLALSAGCGSSGGTSGGGSSGSPAASGSPVAGGTLVFARTGDLLSTDPTAIADNLSIWAEEQIFETLYTVDNDGRGVHPYLATGYTLSTDKLTWTFTLRQGVKFSDGTPLTADDVAFSINRARKSTAGLGYIDSAIKNVTAKDASTVVVTTKYPWAPLLADISLFTNGIYPKDFGGKTAEEFFASPVGTGPFMFKSWTKGQSFDLVRNPGYWQTGKPHLDGVSFTNVPDDNTRALQLQGGQADIDMYPPFSSIESMKAKPGVKVTLFPGTRVDMLLLNQKFAPFKDVHVRAAVNYAIDRDAMVSAVLFGNGQAANSYMPPTLIYYDASLPAQKQDMAKAKQELAASGYPNGFDVEFLADNLAQDQSVAQIVQQALKPLGINVKIRTIDMNQIFTTQGKGDYQLSIDYWTMDIPDPDEDTTWFLSPAGGGNCYFTWYNNPTMTTMVSDAAKEFDTTKRADLYKQIQQLALQDLPQLYLFYSPLAYAYTDKVQGFFVTPLGNMHLEDVWLNK
jgi:peptide/nickel transport system substrate-binding protein